MWDALSPMWEGSWRSLSNVGRICFTGGNAYKHVFLRCKEIDVWLAKSIPYFIHHLGVEAPALSLSATPGEKGLPTECEGQQVKTAQCHKGVEKKKKNSLEKKKNSWDLTRPWTTLDLFGISFILGTALPVPFIPCSEVSYITLQNEMLPMGAWENFPME